MTLSRAIKFLLPPDNLPATDRITVLHQRNAKEFLAMICLAPGVAIESAEATLDAITRRLDEQDPSEPLRTDI